MNKQSTILLTGAAGFIGSYLLGYLNEKGYDQIIISDDFSLASKKNNYEGKNFIQAVERDELFTWLAANNVQPEFVFHLGARTDTTEFDYAVLERLNLEYSKLIWNYCTQHSVPLVYASSAATYGDGKLGYSDDHEIVDDLQPLNPYGVSKNEFDKWVLGRRASQQPPFWAGLKFFNVYGPNEYHKGRMASVVLHAFKQAKESGQVRLFRSHKDGYKDGEQLRDFIFVKDVAEICFWLMQNKTDSGLYNVGTGKARTFNDLVYAVFSALETSPAIDYIDTPEDIRDKYQYFTEADMHKLHEAGYSNPFTSLEDGIRIYVKDFLSSHGYY
jgi:ADP-L-glycero-D-manno-heptose 6-epimerase